MIRLNSLCRGGGEDTRRKGRSYDHPQNQRVIPTVPAEIWLCQHCDGININVAGTKYCGQCGELCFTYGENGRERV